MNEITLPEKIMTIPPEWIDRNGHVNVAYYVLAFDYATDDFYDLLGIGEAYQKQGFSMFTLGMNVDYLREIFEGTRIKITTQLINFDKKRMHYFHRMINLDAAYRAATNECIAIHVNLEQRRGASFSTKTMERLDQMLTDHAQLKTPTAVSRKL